MIAEILSISGEKQGNIELPDNLFKQESNSGLVWEVVNNYLANQRQGSAKTKTKGEVRGGGKKPWRQKHTGRARHGSVTSPIWVGGGVVFGPMPRDYSIRMPKKKRRRALIVALSEKLNSNHLKIVADIPKDINKTKEMAKVLSGLGLNQGRILMVLDSVSENLIRSTRNIPNLGLKCAKNLNIYDVVSSDQLIFSKTGIEQFIDEVGLNLIGKKVEEN